MRPQLIFSNQNLKASLCAIAILLTSWTEISAQYGSAPKRYFGIESNMASRSFQITSNIPEINNLKVTAKGFSLGILAGSEAFLGKLKYGLFSTAVQLQEKIEVVEGEISLNAFPLAILEKKSKFFKPYAFMSFDHGSLKFYGNYKLPLILPAAPPSAHACPDAEEEEEEEVIPVPAESTANEKDPHKERFLGRVMVSRFNLGAGMNIHLPVRNKFANLFAEVKYGWPVGIKTVSLEFEKTKVSKQVAINVGVSFGFSNL
jgi:hypothetical protein